MMYSIISTDGKIINIKATNMEWDERERAITLTYNGRFVARINMDDVAGWIDSDYVIKDTPKIGHWVRSIYSEEHVGVYRCSCCGKEILVPNGNIDDLFIDCAYCCHCGAKMIEQKESEEV